MLPPVAYPHTTCAMTSMHRIYVVLKYHMNEVSEHELDWAEGQDLTGASDLQVKFVKGLVMGLSKTAACRAAGYRGEGAALRGHASRLAKSNKVRALLAWAKAGGGGPSDVPGDLNELKKILWKHARGADKNHSIKATEVLHRLAAAEQAEATRAEVDDPQATLQQISELSPVLAALLARQHNINWSIPSVESAIAEIERLRNFVLGDPQADQIAVAARQPRPGGRN